MTLFANIGEIDSAIRCLRDARKSILALYPLTEKNEWVSPPPPEVNEALQMLNVAREHLENLCEYGNSSYELKPLLD